MPRSYGTTNVAPYSSAPAVGSAGDTYYNSTNKVLYLSDGSVWNPDKAGVPSGGAGNTLLMKNSAGDYDTSWTADPSVNTLTAAGNVNSTGNNTFGQIDARRNNGGGQVLALQNAGTFRGMAWDGVSAYQALATLAFAAEQNTTPTAAGGAIQLQTTSLNTTGTVARMRIGANGKVQVPGAMQLGQAVLTDPAAGTILDLSNGLLAQRRVAYSLVNGANNNIALPISTFVEFISPTAAFNISGIVGGVDGALIDFLYVGTQNITFNHQSASSTAANQIVTMSSVDETLTGPCSGTLRYNASSSRWVLVTFLGKPQSGTTVQEKYTYITAGWGSGAVTTYTSVGNQPAGWGTLTKKYAGTTMVVEFGCSCWITTTINVVNIGVSPTNSSGNVTKVGSFYFNEVGAHRAFTGMTSIAAAAGAYTYTAWVQVPSGSSLNSDTNDIFWMKVREVWP